MTEIPTQEIDVMLAAVVVVREVPVVADAAALDVAVAVEAVDVAAPTIVHNLGVETGKDPIGAPALMLLKITAIELKIPTPNRLIFQMTT